MRHKYLIFSLILSMFLILTTSGCGNQTATTPAQQDPSEIVIAYQPGLIFAGLLILKEQKLLEKAFPNTKFTWKILGSGAAIRDGMISGQIQVGLIGLAPFLVGWDKGVPLRMVAGLPLIDAWLTVKDPNIKSFKDFTPDKKIAVSSPDSLYSVLLRAGVQKELQDARALDKNLVNMDNSLGVQALRSNQISGHITTAPFQWQESEDGGRVIYKSKDTLGLVTTASLTVTNTFAQQYPHFTSTLYQEFVSSTKLIKTDLDKAATILSQEQDGKISAAQYKVWLQRPELQFETQPTGFLKIANFMKSIGMISKAPASIRDVTTKELNGKGN